MATVTARVSDELKAEVEEFWNRLGVKPSSGVRHVIEEWWAMERYPHLAFRTGVAGRRAVVRGGPDVWEIVSAAEDYADDLDGLYAHFEFAPQKAIDEALEYAELFPEGVRRMIEENRRVESALSGSR